MFWQERVKKCSNDLVLFKVIERELEICLPITKVRKINSIENIFESLSFQTSRPSVLTHISF